MDAPREQVHGSCVVVDGRGVLIRGASGTGKSDLAARLIVEAGAVLVADDRVDLALADGVPVARPPAALAGLIEVRGVGIIRLDWQAAAPVALVADLVAPPVPRLPEPRQAVLAGVAVPALRLVPFETSAVAKLRLAVRAGLVSAAMP